MPETASPPCPVVPAPAGQPQPAPFLLTTNQGEGARALLRHVTSLPLPGADARLLAVVVAIRAARGGVGNLTGVDLSGLRLGDPHGAVDALRGLGWRIDDALLSGDPATPVPVTVPAFADAGEHPLPLGAHTRSRVSGWTTRTLAAKPLKKLPPAGRLAGLFLAAHGTPDRPQPLPSDLPPACRAALPDLLSRGFIAELSDDRYRLDSAMRHLSGLPAPADRGTPTTSGTAKRKTRPTTVAPRFEFDPQAWTQWKDNATPGLRRHAESVEFCSLCALPPERVAQAFMEPPPPPKATPPAVSYAYAGWKGKHPGRGPAAAAFTVAFRAEHGHGPSYYQLCTGMGWQLTRPVNLLAIRRLQANGWLTETTPVPWTLRPGGTAQAQGITLPSARRAPAAGSSRT